MHALRRDKESGMHMRTQTPLFRPYMIGLGITMAVLVIAGLVCSLF